MNTTQKLLLVGIILVLLGTYFWQRSVRIEPPITACTLEARVCPDGSSVGRTGPNCEFAQCPGESSIADWKMRTDAVSGVQFQYPEKIGASYINEQSWPPVVAVTAGVVDGCTGSFVSRSIGARTYCVQSTSEGAAGSTYTTYTYTTSRVPENKTIALTFVLRYPQCANYDEPTRTTCQNERATFSLDAVIDRIVGTVRFTTAPVPGVTPKPVTIVGTEVCLPHINTDGPQTMECALGIQSDSGTYYGLDFSLLSENPPDISTGERVQITGVVTPKETLSSSFWQRYPIVGILSATEVRLVQ